MAQGHESTSAYQIDCTVAICTLNRAGSLAHTLASMRQLRTLRGLSWELLIVDNGSTDATLNVVEDFCSLLPIRLVVEHGPGLSQARNRAVREARGALILWTDDDVIVGSSWLREYVDGANQFPQAAFFGGPITPRFETAPPYWLRRNLKEFGGAFAMRELGPGRRLITDSAELPYGANFGLRRETIRSCPFTLELGRGGQDALGGEETHLLRTMLDQGKVGVWLGEARVEHMIPLERMTEAYLWRYFLAAGRSEARARKLSGRPVGAEMELEAKRAKMARRLKRCFFRNSRWAESFRRTAVLAGTIAELRT